MSPDGMPPRGEGTSRTMAPTALPVSMPCDHRTHTPLGTTHLTLRLSHPCTLPLVSQVPLPVAPPLAAPPAWMGVQVGPPVGPLPVAPLPEALRVCLAPLACLAPLPQGCLWLA